MYVAVTEGGSMIVQNSEITTVSWQFFIQFSIQFTELQDTHEALLS